jgi:hypothetical protein
MAARRASKEPAEFDPRNLGSVISQLTEMAVPRALCAEILRRIDGLSESRRHSQHERGKQ